MIKCLDLMNQIQEDSLLWILKPLRVLLMATKRIFFESMKQLTTTSKLKNDLIATLNRFKSSRNFSE